MKLEAAFDLLRKEYVKALKNDFVRDPLAYALYRTWKIVDTYGRKTNLEGKCGSCAFAKPVMDGSKCLVECTSEEHIYRYRNHKHFKVIRPRTRLACNDYKPEDR